MYLITKQGQKRVRSFLSANYSIYQLYEGEVMQSRKKQCKEVRIAENFRRNVFP